MGQEQKDSKASILNVLQMVVLIGTLIKTLFSLITEAEDPAIPGATKKAGVLAFMEALLRAAATKIAGIDDTAIAIAKEATSWVIDAYVALKNAIGHFTHKAV